MRYVMVPVPREFVLDIMRWVLFRAPEEDDSGAGAMRDEARLRRLVEESDELTAGILLVVAKATIEDRPLRLTEAADELDQPADVVRAKLREVNAQALGGGRDLVKVSNESAVGVHGNTGRISYLTMRPEHARLVRAVSKGADAPST